MLARPLTPIHAPMPVAKHDVTFELPVRKLGHSAVEFRIKRDRERFGTMRVSKGPVVWFPKNASNGHRMTWEEFDKLM